MDFGWVGFFGAYSVWLFSILLFAFSSHSLSLKLLISNPPDQSVLHESAAQQTKRNKDSQSHDTNCKQNLIPRKWHLISQNVTETLPKKFGAIREEFIRVVQLIGCKREHRADFISLLYRSLRAHSSVFHKPHELLLGDVAILVVIHQGQQPLDLVLSDCQFILQL